MKNAEIIKEKATLPKSIFNTIACQAMKKKITDIFPSKSFFLEILLKGKYISKENENDLMYFVLKPLDQKLFNDFVIINSLDNE